MTDHQEKAIIASVCSGQADDYRWLVERYHRGLITHLYNLLHDEDQAEDIAQEALIRAYDKINQYDPAYAFSTWLYKIADNLAFRHLQQAKPQVDVSDMAESLADDRLPIEDEVDRALTGEAIRRAVDRLPAAYRQAIALYYWDNFSYEDIAVIMDRPVGTVRTWLHRAKEQLRKELYGQI